MADTKIPTFWEVVKLLATGFVMGTPGDLWRIRRALAEILEWGAELVVALLKLVTRWLGILTGPITFPLLAVYVLHLARISEAKRKAAREEAEERSLAVWRKP